MLNGPSSLFPRPPSHDFRIEAQEVASPFPQRLSHASSSPKAGAAPSSTSTPSSSSAFEHPFDRPRILALPFEPQLDFYSQRLRQLAGATSPNASAGNTRKLSSPFGGSSAEPSPAKKGSDVLASSPPKETASSSSVAAAPSSTGANNGSSSSLLLTQPQPASSSSPASSVGSKGDTTGAGGPGSPHLKSCEFCGKSFRFMSNLIVHRRSHTGEKPYKCHICQHACTQASKLKRHMKTHRSGGTSKLSPGSLDNTCSLESGRSTPDSLCVVVDKEVGGAGTLGEQLGNGNDSDSHTNGDYDEEEEDDEEVEELSEDEEEDEGELGGDEEDEEGELAIAEDLSTPRGQTSSPAPAVESLSAKLLREKALEEQQHKQERNGTPIPSARKSLLGEVMEKIGLADIQQYNEAYKQALQESFAKGTGVKQEHRSMLEGALVSNGPDGGSNGKMIGQPALDFGHGLLRAFDRRSPFDSKRAKLDKAGHDLYAGMWLPSLPHRDFFMEVADRHKSSSSSESALISVTPGCRLGGAVSPRPGTSGGNFLSSCSTASSNGAAAAKGLKGDRRSDTCEYCGKIFKNCSNLTVHRRSHTGEKPYKCELCSYACAQSSKLTRHMKTHGRIGKDVYRCRFCDMPFSVPSTLEKHMRKCVVSQTPGSALPLAILDKDSDSKEMEV